MRGRDEPSFDFDQSLSYRFVNPASPIDRDKVSWAYSRASGVCSNGLPMTSPRASNLSPIDTAVAATTSDTASATVAISSSAAMCRFDSVCSARGGAKPGLPVSFAMVVTILRESVRSSHHRCRCRRPFGRIRAEALKNKGDLMEVG